VSLRRWQDRAQDILDAIEEIQAFLADNTFDQFRADAKTQKAVTMDLAIIGEAARFVPEDIVAATPAIPWSLMRGMRNRVMHGYFEVDVQIVWETSRQDLPPLVQH
jgi:uncharacterized protein with HEPN domain